MMSNEFRKDNQFFSWQPQTSIRSFEFFAVAFRSKRRAGSPSQTLSIAIIVKSTSLY